MNDPLRNVKIHALITILLFLLIILSQCSWVRNSDAKDTVFKEASAVILGGEAL